MIPARIANDNGDGRTSARLPVRMIRPAGCPAGIAPSDWRAAVAARIEALQDQMQALLDVLDAVDGDADLEPDADAEPLGVAQMWTGSAWRYEGTDLEADEYT